MFAIFCCFSYQAIKLASNLGLLVSEKQSVRLAQISVYDHIDQYVTAVIVPADERLVSGAHLDL